MQIEPDIQVQEPSSTLARRLRAALSAERWSEVVSRAHERVRILEAVVAARATGLSHRKALAAVAPDVQWSTYLHWWRRAARADGPDWERQLDARVTPPPERVPPEVIAAACTMRRLLPTISCDVAREHLVAQFGAGVGGVSDTNLRRIWKAAGLQQPRGGGRRSRPTEKVSALAGGGGLALLRAAAIETGVLDELGGEAVAQAVRAAEAQPTGKAGAIDGPRDDRGRFTGDYNRVVRGGPAGDPRWETDGLKRERRRLRDLSIVRSRPAVVGQKLLAIGVSPLLTERRGFDGLEGPHGAWLEALGGHAYRDTTLDKCLAELALVDAGEALWSVHARQWQRVAAAWCEDKDAPDWLRHVLYVDATQDPYWTRHYAASGKVSRVGRVMPCVTRLAVMGGPGVPLIVETHAGSRSLKKDLLPLLDRMDDVLGSGELGRLTVVDCEAATTPLLRELSARPDRWFITVLKGGTAKGAQQVEQGAWQRFREHDLIRSLTVVLAAKGDHEGELRLRGVEMVREGSRNPTSTVFVTNASDDELPLQSVPGAYLSRWPHQEQRFRDGRNGLGLHRTHGYGGARVTHVALATAQEKAAGRVARARSLLAAAVEREEEIRSKLEKTPRGERTDLRALLRVSSRDRGVAQRRLDEAEREQARLATTPREIYVRDTTRDGIVTCAKLTALMLVEYVLKEYFGGLRMEARTFIELFVAVPVTIRESKREVVYQLRENPRSPENTQRLRHACEEVNRRAIATPSGQRLTFEVVANGGVS